MEPQSKAACPGCGKTDRLKVATQSLTSGRSIYCACDRSYEGPIMRTEDEAWEAWNTRPVEDELRAEVKEWLCITCRTVFPGPPQQGLKCVICPRCGGDTAPMNSVLLHEAHAEVERLTARLAEATEIIRFFYARTQAGFSLQKAAWTCPWCDKDTSATGDGSWTHESWCPWQRAAAWLAAQEAE